MKMKPISTIFAFALLFVFATMFTACKKDDVKKETVTSKFNTVQFFAGTENADLPTKKLVDFFKTKHAQNPNFLPNLVRQCGYPVWDKTIKQYPSAATARSTTEGAQDSVIHLPFVHQNTTVVNSFVEALINDTIEVELYEKYKYTSLPKGQINATGLTAEKYLNQFLFLQKRVFNHKFFKIVDTTLFKSLTPNNGANNAVVKFIKLEESSASGTQVNSFDPNCFHYTTSYRTYELINGLWTFTQHTRHHVICFPPVQSFILAEGGGPGVIGSISGFNWSGIDPLGGGGSNAGGTLGTGGTPIGTNPTSGGYNGNGPNAPVGFIDAEDLFLLITQLKTFLPNITQDEETFLLGKPEQLKQLINYLNINNTNEDKYKASVHINKMRTDPSYLNIVFIHTNTTSSNTVWWDDSVWLSIPQNQNLLYDENKPYDLIDFPIHAPDEPLINSDITISTIDPTLPAVNGLNIGNTIPRNNTEDLTFGTNGDATGISTILQNAPNNFLEGEMKDLLRKCTIKDSELQDAAFRYLQIFKTNTSNSATVSDNTVTRKVEESGVFKNFVLKFGNIFNKSLKAKSGVLMANAPDEFQFPLKLGFRPQFNTLYHKFNGLQILLNDTESTEIKLDNYSVDALGNWNANITVTIYDHFGLDKNDALTYQQYHTGFATWWLLQHTRNYVPFISKVVIKTKINGNYHLAL